MNKKRVILLILSVLFATNVIFSTRCEVKPSVGSLVSCGSLCALGFAASCYTALKIGLPKIGHVALKMEYPNFSDLVDLASFGCLWSICGACAIISGRKCFAVSTELLRRLSGKILS